MKVDKFNIVIYGCDNTGKTTLAKALEKEFQETADKVLSVVYTKSLGPATFSEQVDFITEHCTNKKTKECDKTYQVEIFDRFPIIEEYVCGNILRGEDNFEKADTSYVSKRIGTINMFIHCNPPFEKVIEWGDREQMEGVKEQAMGLCCMYSTVGFHFNNIKSRIFLFDYTKQEVSKFAKDVVLEVLNFFVSQDTVERYGVNL